MLKPMNEEIKELKHKILTECRAWSMEYMFQKMKEYEQLVVKKAYLLGAKDMKDAVKFKRTGWQDAMVTIVLDTIEKQAQQFIDSLEGKDE